MKQFILGVFTMLGIVYSCCSCSHSEVDRSLQPNILILQPDQLRADVLGCAGHPDILTPHIDQLASNGIRFTHAVSGGPVCCPFRATFQTGLYIHEHGVRRNNVLLDTNHVTFAELLVEQGYSTGYIGKWHLDGGVPATVGGYVEAGARRQGWQDWHGYEKAHEFFEVWEYNEQKEKVRVEGYHWEPTWQTDMALQFIEKNEKDEKPWCYYLAYGPPHNPFQCPQEFLDMYNPDSLNLPDELVQTLTEDEEQEVRKLRQIYYGQVTAVDLEIGRLMAGLKEMGTFDNTIVFFVSDHGDVLGAHAKEIKDRYVSEVRSLQYYLRTKGKPYISALRIPFIVQWPNKIPSGQVNDVLVNSVDLTPTLLNLAGLSKPEQMSGHSMVEWCFEMEGPENDALYLGLWEDHQAWRGVWDGRFLYACLDYEVLFDHQKDPHEINNLFHHENYAQIKEEMWNKLIELAKSTNDPIVSRIVSEQN